MGSHARQELHRGFGENAIGAIVGRHSTFPNKPSLDRSKIKFLSETFHPSGLNLSKTTHDGKFFMCSYRQIQMASGSMAQVRPSSDHRYFDKSKMQVPLLNFGLPIVNYLSNKAMNARDNSGKIQMGIINNAVCQISGEQIEYKKIAPHIIFTAPEYNKTTGYHIPFSNCGHVEKYECIPEWGAMIYDYIGHTRNKASVDYFTKIIAIYPSRTQTKAEGSRQKRDRFQTPSKYFWIRTDQHQGI